MAVSHFYKYFIPHNDNRLITNWLKCGLWLRDKTINANFIFIPNYDKQNYALCKLVVKVGHSKFEQTNQNLIKIYIVF